MLLWTALGLHQIAAKLRGRLFRSNHNRVIDGINLIVLQFFGMIGGVTVLVVVAVEFEPLVIFSGADSDLCFTLAGDNAFGTCKNGSIRQFVIAGTTRPIKAALTRTAIFRPGKKLS